MSGRRAALVLAPLVAIALHLPTLSADFTFDDRAVVGLNPLMHDIRDAPALLATPYWNVPRHGRTLYRPLTTLSYALNRAVAGGLDPRGFHLVNVLGHGAVTLLVTALACAVLPGTAAPLAAGLLFAVHPVHVEAVAGIVGRAEILAAAGVLGTILLHRRALAAPATRFLPWMAAAWGAFVLACLAKESAIVAPLLCWLGDRAFPPATPPGPATDGGVTPAGPGAWWRSWMAPASRARRRAVLYAGSAVAIVVVSGVRFAVLGSLGVGGTVPFIDNPAASAGAIAGRLTALGAVARYAILLLWPARLSADYSYAQIPVIRSPADPWAIAGALVLVALVGGAAALRRRSPAAGLALAWMAVAALATSNLVVFIGTLLAERLMYLPSVGLCLLLGAGVAEAARRGCGKAVLAALTVVVILGAGRTWARLPDWHDDFSLYSSAALASPRSARIRYNLGNAYLRKSDWVRAEEQFRAALGIHPAFDDARVNLAMALLQRGRPGEALGLLQEAAARDPGSADIAINVGMARRGLGDDAGAEADFRRALALDPGSARAWNNLGSIAMARGDLPRAVDHLKAAVDREPHLAILRINYADALAASGRTGEADAEFRAAWRDDPDLPEAMRGMGEVALRRGEPAEAERRFAAAAAASQPSARALNFLGYLRAARGDARGAADAYERALAVDPRLADAHRSLGLLYARQLGDGSRAARHLEATLRLDPRQEGAATLRRMLDDLDRK